MTVTQDMVGHKLGEFAITRKRFTYKCVSVVLSLLSSTHLVSIRSTERPRTNRLRYSQLYMRHVLHSYFCYRIVFLNFILLALSCLGRGYTLPCPTYGVCSAPLVSTLLSVPHPLPRMNRSISLEMKEPISQ